MLRSIIYENIPCCCPPILYFLQGWKTSTLLEQNIDTLQGRIQNFSIREGPGAISNSHPTSSGCAPIIECRCIAMTLHTFIQVVLNTSAAFLANLHGYSFANRAILHNKLMEGLLCATQWFCKIDRYNVARGDYLCGTWRVNTGVDISCPICEMRR